MRKTLKWKVAQQAEIRWWKKYLRAQDAQTYLKWKKEYWKEFFARVSDDLSLNSGHVILDAGCGPAGIFMILNENSVDAIDPLLDSYEDELTIFSKREYPGVTFVTGSIEGMEKSRKYDIIFCINALNHVDDIRLSISNIVGAAKTGSKILISIDAHNYKMMKLLFRGVPFDILHPHQYSIEDYEKMWIEKNCSIRKRITLKRDFLFSYYLLLVEKTGQ